MITTSNWLFIKTSNCEIRKALFICLQLFSLWKFKKRHERWVAHTTHHFLPLLGKSHQHWAAHSVSPFLTVVWFIQWNVHGTEETSSINSNTTHHYSVRRVGYRILLFCPSSERRSTLLKLKKNNPYKHTERTRNQKIFWA